MYDIYNIYYIYICICIAFTTEGFFEAAIESWPEWDIIFFISNLYN